MLDIIKIIDSLPNMRRAGPAEKRQIENAQRALGVFFQRNILIMSPNLEL